MPLRLLGAFGCALFSFACYWSIRLGYADLVATDRSRVTLEQAIRLAPGNPEYYVRLAQADPPSAVSAMEKAAALNPLNSALWMELSRVAEEQQDFRRAENALLNAVRVDKTFAPRWLLAQYYFRRRDEARFWPAMHSAMAASYDEVEPLFDDCWALASSPEMILQRAIPDRVDVLGQYLDYVLAKDRLDLAAAVASKLTYRADRDDVPSLLSYCDRLLEDKQVTPALEVWNSLARNGLLDYAALAPEKGVSLTNGNFDKPFLMRAFDWRLVELPGVSARRVGKGAGLRLSFSGKQPESCEILSQYLPVAAGKKYRLGVRYEMSRLDGETGLSWRVLDVSDGSDLLEGTGPLAGREGAESEQGLAFATLAETQLVKLVLAYQRVLGTVRIEGEIVIRKVTVGFAE